MSSPALRAPRRPGPRVLGAVGVVVIIALWWILADTVFSRVGVSPNGTGGSIPTPLEVVQAMVHDGFGFYAKNIAVTLNEALQGYLWGNAIAIAMAILVVVIPRVESVVLQLSVISYCIPIVAIGPIARIIIGIPDSGQPAGAAIFLAALLVVFTTLIGTLLGLRSADQTSLDLISVYGGGRWKQFTMVRLISALPGMLNGLRIGAPSAFLGAVIGEYLGGVDLGVGPALVNAQQSLAVPRAWAIAILIGLVSGAAYALVGLLARFVIPWSSGAARGGRVSR